jgi:hypothetical protein
MGRATRIGSWRLTTAIGCVVATAAACEERRPPVEPPVPAALHADSGHAQAAAPGTPLPAPLVVRVTSAGGVALPGVEIAFAAESGSGTVAPPSAITDAAGRARAGWTLGPGTGRQRVRATVPAAPQLEAEFVADATAPDPGRIAFELGTPEVVFRYRRDRCETMDLPDMTARAVRLASGGIALYSGNAPRAYTSYGTGFDDLRRECTPSLVSADEWTAPGFRNQEWLATVYREGGAYHAIVHNEFHDPLPAHCRPGDTSPANPCWYNALTYARSADGRRFEVMGRGGEAADSARAAHVVAGPPQRWDPGEGRAPGPYGYFTPSNIVRREDGFYYALFFALPERGNQHRRGSCVMRTADLSDPGSWRAWNGAAYDLPMPSPYTAAAATACTIVFPHGVNGSLTFNTFLDRYLYIGASGALVDGVLRCGFLYATSADLVTWSAPRVLKEAPVPIPPCAAGGPNTGREYYPSLIDHDDTTVNFEVTGRTGFLYYTRYNDEALDRDLLRVPVTMRAQ